MEDGLDPVYVSASPPMTDEIPGDVLSGEPLRGADLAVDPALGALRGTHSSMGSGGQRGAPVSPFWSLRPVPRRCGRR